MGKLIKNHWARLIVLTAAAYHVAASLEGFFWPKILFDWLTKNLDDAVKPVPILQTINLCIALLTFGLEWPLGFIAGTNLHSSIVTRVMWLPLASVASVLLYQGTNASLYYLIGCLVYVWAYGQGEVICAIPWTLPKRGDRRIEKA